MLIKRLDKYFGLSLLIFGFLILPLLKDINFFESFEMIKVITFVCLTNVYLAISLFIPYYRIYFKREKIILTFAALWLVLAVSSIWNGNEISSWVGQFYRYQGLITLVVYAGFMWLVKKLFFERKKASLIISLAGLLNSVIIFCQYILINLFNQPIYNFDGRMTANMGNPNFAGGFIALSFAFAKLYWWPIFFGAVILTQSRSALIAFGVISILKIFRLIKNNSVKFGLALIIGIMIIICFPSRIESTFENRTVIWSKAIEAFAEKPILGWGVEKFETAFSSTLTSNDFDLKNIRIDKAHNEILEIAISGGILGLIIYLYFLYQIFIFLWNNKKSDWEYNLLACFLGFLVVSNLNIVNINEYLFLYFIAGAVMKKSWRRYHYSGKQG